jgi:hypothetical protein
VKGLDLLHFPLSLSHSEPHRNLLWKASSHPSERKEDYEIISSPQSAGSLYLSYPCAMQHSPLYPQCDWTTRVIAVQARCLLTQNDFERYASIVTPEFPQILQLIYLAIQDGFPSSQDQSMERIIFTSPTLDEILTVQQELAPRWEDKKKKSCNVS